MPGGYSGAFSNIMPGIVGHYNATKEDSKNPTQVEKLHAINEKQALSS